MAFAARSALDSCTRTSHFSSKSIWFLCSSRSTPVWNSHAESLDKGSCSSWTASSARNIWTSLTSCCSTRIISIGKCFSCTPLMSLLDFFCLCECIAWMCSGEASLPMRCVSFTSEDTGADAASSPEFYTEQQLVLLDAWWIRVTSVLLIATVVLGSWL